MSSVPAVEYQSNPFSSEPAEVRVMTAEEAKAERAKLERRRLVAQARRIAKEHGLRMVKCRSPYRSIENYGQYRLTASITIAGPEFQLSPEDVIAVCVALGGGK